MRFLNSETSYKYKKQLIYLVIYYLLILINIYLLGWAIYFNLENKWARYLDEEVISISVSTSITTLFSLLLMPHKNGDNLKIRKAFILCMLGVCFLTALQIFTLSNMIGEIQINNTTNALLQTSKNIYHQGECNLTQIGVRCSDSYDWFQNYLNQHCNSSFYLQCDNYSCLSDNCSFNAEIKKLLLLETHILMIIAFVSLIFQITIIGTSLHLYQVHWLRDHTWERIQEDY